MSVEILPAALLKRKAIVYVRQSTQTQVQTNLESQRRQYDLVEVARRHGFTDIEVIDDDLGRSASGSVGRPGFDRLVASVCAGDVGAVLCLDASRLSRNGRDWHHLLELCGLVQARVIDVEGVYDPCRPNDRLLLGMNRPETQSTSYSTFWTPSLGSARQFWTGARLPATQAVPPANVSDMLSRKAAAEGAAQAGAIQGRGDFCIGAPRRHFVNPGNSFFWRLQRAFCTCGPHYA